MGDRAAEMVQVALDAFVARDVERARSLVELDELIDRTNRRVVGKVLELTGNNEGAEWGMRMIVASRCIERIGDNAVDIGEQTEFLVTGEFHEFSDAVIDVHRVGAGYIRPASTAPMEGGMYPAPTESRSPLRHHLATTGQPTRDCAAGILRRGDALRVRGVGTDGDEARRERGLR